MSDETQAVLDRVRALICYFDAPIATDPITGTPEIESDALVRKAMVREVRTLLATVDALRGDARRLDWLEATYAETYRPHPDGEWEVIAHNASGHGHGPNLRAAIDAARTPTPEGR